MNNNNNNSSKNIENKENNLEGQHIITYIE